MIKLLDVTLRDGGYKTNFHYSFEDIRHLLLRLDQSNIDYIEVGYRNGPLKLQTNMGLAATSPRSYLEFCKKWIQRSKLTVIYHPRNIEISDLNEMKECGVDCVRICFPFQNPESGFHAINIAKQLNFEVFVNLTRVSQYTKEYVTSMARQIQEHDVRAIYLADSNGSLTPPQIGDLFSYLKRNTQAAYGFHAHNNLFLAQANALEAIKCGVQFIDASLSGFGKGAGNLQLEGIISYLYAQGHEQYSLPEIFDGADYVSTHLNKYESKNTKDLILGLLNLSIDDAYNLGQYENAQEYYSLAVDYKNKKILQEIA